MTPYLVRAVPGRWRTVPRDQACAVLGISPWDLAALIAGGALPHRITERALEAYIAAHLPGRKAAAS